MHGTARFFSANFISGLSNTYYIHTMSDAPAADIPTAAESTFAPPHEAGSIGSKVNRILDGLKTKNAKLAEDNRKLKEALAVAKSSGSRIRRIPKKKVEEASA